ncbi:MAG: hypothetical protein JRI23_12260 [Deltaproteobacteria bacterium]|jgi:hypothetical protein|nr:hypothetical protein [Deltaproteobacteria bacterium]MBW2532485.1 hypothetical protein [Deltaproteobacteria bacterium]
MVASVSRSFAHALAVATALALLLGCADDEQAGGAAGGTTTSDAAGWTATGSEAVSVSSEPANIPGKYVGGHQMLAMPRYGGNHTLETALEEIEMWDDAGLDAVMLFDLRNEDNLDFQASFLTYLESAAIHGSTVKLAPSFLGAQGSADDPDLVAFMGYLTDPTYAPGAFVAEGRGQLITTWFGQPNIVGLGEHLETTLGLDVHIEPCPNFRHFTSGDPNEQAWTDGEVRTPNVDNYETLLTTLYDHPEWLGVEGIAAFSFTTKPEDQRVLTEILATFADAKGITGRATITPYYRGLPFKNNWMVYEGYGFMRLLASWRGAIESGVNAVELITLNDFAECTYVNSWEPDDPPIITDGWNRAEVTALLDHSGFREASKRYIRWFKTGVEPPIEEDELYYAYRLHPRDAANYYDLTQQQKDSLAPWKPTGVSELKLAAMYRREGIPALGYNQFDSTGLNTSVLSDGFHALVRLTAPADVHINGEKIGDTLPAGEHHVTKP